MTNSIVYVTAVLYTPGSGDYATGRVGPDPRVVGKQGDCTMCRNTKRWSLFWIRQNVQNRGLFILRDMLYFNYTIAVAVLQSFKRAITISCNSVILKKNNNLVIVNIKPVKKAKLRDMEVFQLI